MKIVEVYLGLHQKELSGLMGNDKCMRINVNPGASTDHLLPCLEGVPNYLVHPCLKSRKFVLYVYIYIYARPPPQDLPF